MKKKITALVIMCSLILSITSCGASGGLNGEAPMLGADGDRGSGGDYGATGAPSEDGYKGGDDVAADMEIMDDSFDAPTPEGTSDEVIEGDTDVAPPQQAGLLTSGEWNDNDNFDFWSNLITTNGEWRSYSESWTLSSLNRTKVIVKNSDGRGAANCKVELKDKSGNVIWTSVTDVNGTAYLFTTLEPENQYTPDKIVVTDNSGKTTETAYTSGGDFAVVINENSAPTVLDLMFVIDTTGSMGDELHYIQTELNDVINRVTKTNSNVDINLSVNFYRDEGDEYIVKKFDFTDDIPKAISNLSEQYATGGGDVPEAVTDALETALDCSWSEDSVKLMFLVLDAPPHTEDKAELPGLIKTASEKGIRIIPVASSGVDTLTEFLCRTMAVATGGTYTFLTDHSGIGGSHLEPTIGNYEIEALNNMIVRIIGEYLNGIPDKTDREQPENTQEQHNDQQNDQGTSTIPVLDTSKSEQKPLAVKTHQYFEPQEKILGIQTYFSIEDLDYLLENCEKGSEILDYAGKIDFEKYALVVEVVTISSGSAECKFGEKGAYMDEGVLKIDYEIEYPEVGTCDMGTYFLCHYIEKSSVMRVPAGV